MKQLNQDIDHRKQALLLCEQGKFTQAREILVELEHAQGLNADACSLMGSILGQLREYEEAVGYFQRAIDSAPDKPQAYAGQARALISLGRVAEAESRYERLIVRQPGSALVIVQLASMLLGQGCHDAAEKRYLQALGLDARSEEALSGLGRLYQTSNKTRACKELLL